MIEPIAKCNKVDITPRIIQDVIDFNELIPKNDLTAAEIADIVTVEEHQVIEQGTDKMPSEIFNGLLNYFLEKGDYRSALWVTLQANTGLRYKDVVKFRKIDLINEHDLFRTSIVVPEQKTKKKRINFVNDSIKMATLMYLWNYPDIKPLDYLIGSEANPKAHNKGYEKETYIDANGKKRCVKINGKFVYKLDANGNKIPTPVSRQQSSQIMRDALVHGLNVSIRNDQRTKSNDNAYLYLASHSLRKTYSECVVDVYVKLFDENVAYAKVAAMEFLMYDLNHSSRAMSYHYIKDYEDTKRTINMRMNLGIEVLRGYFETERQKYLNKK